VSSKEALVRRLAREQGLQVADRDDLDIPSRILQAARVTFGKHGLARTTIDYPLRAKAPVGSVFSIRWRLEKAQG
jgi:hypothetical protein